VAAALEVEVGADIILLERLREVDGEPWVHTVTHIPLAIAPGLADEDMTDQSLYETLQARYGVRFATARRGIEAAIPSRETARLLGIGKATPVLVLRSVMRDPAGRPVESFVAYHRGDRARFDVTLGSGATAKASMLRPRPAP
jgi:GntR family transcriptional regulator